MKKDKKSLEKYEHRVRNAKNKAVRDEGEKYLEKGIITKEELDAVKKEFKAYEKEVKKELKAEEEALKVKEEAKETEETNEVEVAKEENNDNN